MGAGLARPFIARWHGAPRALRPPCGRGGRGRGWGRCGGAGTSRTPLRCPVAGAPQLRPGGAGAPRGRLRAWGSGLLPCGNFAACGRAGRPPAAGAPLPRPEGWRGAVRAGRGSASVSAAAPVLRPRFVRPDRHLVAVSSPQGSFSRVGLMSGFCKILPSPLGAK